MADPRSKIGGTVMCMNCGCGEVDKRHQPTDITREDLQRAADGSGMTLRQAAEAVARSSQKIVETGGGSELTAAGGSEVTAARWSDGKRA